MNSELIAFAAFGDWHESVPKGHVAVSAGNPKRYFLVKAGEYRAGMAIDVNQHAELKGLGAAPNSHPASGDAGLGQVKPWKEVIDRFNATNQAPKGSGNHGWKQAVEKFNKGAR